MGKKANIDKKDIGRRRGHAIFPPHTTPPPPPPLPPPQPTQDSAEQGADRGTNEKAAGAIDMVRPTGGKAQ
jgi:hypothetical protein